MSKSNNNNYSHTFFGKLTDAYETTKYVIIKNDHGDTRMMSKPRYRGMAANVLSKAKTLIGQDVNIRTSQNTGNWSDDKWFSDVYV